MPLLQSTPTNAAAAAACSQFRAHAFVQNVDRCCDCSRPAHEHTAQGEKEEPEHKTYDADNLRTILRAKEGTCTTFTGHYWLWNRCRDCGRPEGSHSVSDGQQPHLAVDPLKAWVNDQNAMKRKAVNFDALSIEDAEKQLAHATNERAATDDDVNLLRNMQLQLLEHGKVTADEHAKRMNQLENAYTQRVSLLEAEVSELRKRTAILEELQIRAQQELEMYEYIKQMVETVIDDAVLNIATTEVVHTSTSISEIDCIVPNNAAEKHTSAPDVAVAVSTIAITVAEEIDIANVDAVQCTIIATESIVDGADAGDDDAAIGEDARHMHMEEEGIEKLSERPSFIRRALQTMQQGRNFVRFSSMHPEGIFTALFIRQLANESVPTLYWSRAGERNVHTSRSLPLADVQAVVLGAQSSTLQLRQASFQSPDALCFSIVGTATSLHLQAGNQQERMLWAHALRKLAQQILHTLVAPASRPRVHGTTWTAVRRTAV